MKKSIYYRNFLATALILLLSFLILGAVFTTWSYRIVMNEQRKGLSSTADDVADMAKTVLKGHKKEVVQIPE